MKYNNITNPFIISKDIPEAFFCDREEETTFLIKQIDNGRNTVIVSPRRMGKTGLIHHLFRQETIQERYTSFFVDIYPTSSLQEMCYILGRSVFERLKAKKTQHWETFFQYLKSLRAGVSFDSVTGEPKLEVGIGSIEHPATTLEEIFAYLESSSTPCIVALDEFQQIAEFPEQRVEALLRSMIQNCRQTTFLFSGSKQHTINQMFLSKSRPFYQNAQLFDLKPLKPDVYTEFATRLFDQFEKHIEPAVIAQVYTDYNATTWYMQMLMNELFALTGQGNTCTMEHLDMAQKNIIQVQEGSYLMQLNTLSSKQKSMLQAIAKEGCAKAVTSQAFVKKHALDSASTVQSALRVLLEKDIVTADNGQYRVSDFFFSHWLQENY
jgi:hypothetical protein